MSDVPLQGYIPKDITQHAKFCKKYPKYDGRGLLIAIIDDGIDVSLPGMQQTSTGIPKIIDCFDFTGAGNVDTSTIKEMDENNNLMGLSGRSLKIPFTWKNPSNKWHLGKKSFHELIQKYTDDEFVRMFKNKNWAERIAENKERKSIEKVLKNQIKDEWHNDNVHIATDHFMGYVMHVSGFPAEKFSIPLIKEFFNKYSPVAYVLWKDGSSEAYIRFHSIEAKVAVKVLENMNKDAKKSDGKIIFQGKEIHCKVLNGEEEEEFWREALDGEEEENYCADFIINKSAKALRSPLKNFNINDDKNNNSLETFNESIVKDSVVDCIVWFDGEKWRACLDPSFSNGNLKDAKILTNFRDDHEYAFITDKISYCIGINQNGNLLQISTSYMEHGSLVAHIAAGNFIKDFERNGIAPGAQIVSMNVICHDKDVKESLQEALLKCIELKVDIVNLSMSISNNELINEIVKEMTLKYGIITCLSAGNDGPLHFSLEYDNLYISENLFLIGSITTAEMKNRLCSSITRTHPPIVCQYTSKGPLKNTGLRGITLTAPGSAIVAPPRWSSTKNKRCDGTSMAAPNASGLIACLLSALKANSILYSPATIRLALCNTALLPEGGDKLNFGDGIIQIFAAFEFLKTFATNSFVPKTLPQLSLRCLNLKGIFLSKNEYKDILKTFYVKLKHNFGNQPIPWILKLFPEAKANFVKHSKSVTKNIFSVEIETTSLKNGTLNYAEICGYDSSNLSLGPLFHLPITVIVPERAIKNEFFCIHTRRCLQELTFYYLQKSLYLKHGIPFSFFFIPPFKSWKCEIAITVMEQYNIYTDLYLKYSTEFSKKLSFRKPKETKKFKFNIKSEQIYELAITSNTTSNEEQKFKLEITFNNPT